MIEASSGSTAVSRGLFRADAGPALHRGGAGARPRRPSSTRSASTAARSTWSTIRAPSTTSRSGSRRRPAAIISTSSPMPSARPTGAATTISPRASSRRWRSEEHPVPAWIVCGAGTGGTSATIGRFIRYQRHRDPTVRRRSRTSVFHRHFADRSVTALPTAAPSRIEGIGRPRVEPSFIPDVIDRMIAVADADSIGAMRALSRRARPPRSAARPAPTCGPARRSIEEMAAARRDRAASSRCCATAASATPAPITTTPGARRTASPGTTRRRRCAASSARADGAAAPPAGRASADARAGRRSGRRR